MKKNFVYLNTEYLPAELAKISVFDRAFLYGDAVYEAFRIYQGRFRFFSQHYDRLKHSANEMEIELYLNKNELKKIIKQLLEINELSDAYVRINISRGLGNIGIKTWSESQSSIFISTVPFSPMPDTWYQNGVSIGISSVIRNPARAIHPQIKSISNLNSLLAKLEAKKRELPELLMLNQQGFVCEASAANIFWINDSLVYTPALENGILGGVTRSEIIHLAQKLNLTVLEGFYKLDSVFNAEEVFLTSTSFEVLPVVKIEDTIIGNSLVGKWSKKLLTIFRQGVTDASI